MTRTLSTTRPSELPARFTAGFAWDLDRRSQVAREVAADLWTLWQDLGGVEALSTQQLWLCERVVFIRRRVLAYETDVLAGRTPTMDAGTYSNHANVLQGYLRTLGLERRARNVRRLADVMSNTVSPIRATEAPK